MITEDYVSFETAKLLKEKGFDWRESPFYSEQDRNEWRQNAWYSIPNPRYDENVPFDSPTLYVTAPHISIQMAMKWLREVHNLYIEIKISKNTFLWGFRVSLSNGNTSCLHTNVFSNYEQASEAAIRYCLEILI